MPPDAEAARAGEFSSGARICWPGSPEGRLFNSGHRFDFFQAVRLLQRLGPNTELVGHHSKPTDEAVRFRAYQTLGFPASAIQEIRRSSPGRSPVLVQNFLGLTGPSGILPLHYSEMLIRFRGGSAGEDAPLRDWLDLFNHRLTSFFYRTWEKYRAYPWYERERGINHDPDQFTRALLSLIGLGFAPLQNRLTVAVPSPVPIPSASPNRISDQTLLFFGGLLSHRPPNVVGLEQLIRGVFEVQATVKQFQGQWLRLADDQQTKLDEVDSHNDELGVSAIAGSRVWDVQGKFLVKLGPLDQDRFGRFLPIEGPSGVPGHALALLSRLIRLYAGPELEFEVQLILRRDQVPGCQLVADDPIGPRLGWNTWLSDEPMTEDRVDTSFTDNFPTGY